MNKEHIQHEGDRTLPCAARETFRCRPDALSDDEKTILSAIVLQKGEAEAGEILANSPEQLSDYTILKGVNSYAALGRYYHRKKTGEGQYIDCSSSECITALVGNEMMEYTMNGRSLGRTGNTGPVMAPHNVYRCKGDDKWISIAVGTEEEWQNLVHAMGDPDWAKDEKFADMYARHKNSAELDRHMAEWTIRFTHMEVMEMLQSAGVAAMPSFCASEILENPHVKARDVITSVQHPVLGRQYVLNPPWKLSETPAAIRKSAPCMGENNEDVFMGLMGMSPERYQDLVDRRIIY